MYLENKFSSNIYYAAYVNNDIITNIIDINYISQLKSLDLLFLNKKLDNPTINIPNIANNIPIDYYIDTFFFNTNMENAAVTIIS